MKKEDIKEDKKSSKTKKNSLGRKTDINQLNLKSQTDNPNPIPEAKSEDQQIIEKKFKKKN